MERKVLKLSDSAYKNIATLGPVGFAPKAPGTVGTAAALVIVALLKPSLPLFLLLVIVSVVLGTVASGRAEKVLGQKDSGHIVIDEVAGYFISMIFLPQTVGYFAAAFVLFRIFDILKPPPINRLQHFHGGVGVMADDIAAGILANIVLQIWRFLI
jgi:phosphatidylglycerophosphatase A